LVSLGISQMPGGISREAVFNIHTLPPESIPASLSLACVNFKVNSSNKVEFRRHEDPFLLPFFYIPVSYLHFWTMNQSNGFRNPTREEI